MKGETVQTQAELMANLTFELAKTCQEKEQLFASAFNLTTAEFRCLQFFRSRDSISVKEISNLMKLTPGRITHILTSLEVKKLIVREVHPNDRRGINVILTEKSRPFIKDLFDGYLELHSQILAKISPDKVDGVLYAMDELVAAVKSWNNGYNHNKSNHQ